MDQNDRSKQGNGRLDQEPRDKQEMLKHWPAQRRPTRLKFSMLSWSMPSEAGRFVNVQ